MVIDEIQQCPPLLDEVHLLIERNPELRFVLTGSSARKLRRGGANLLAGRARVARLHPLVSVELEGDRLLDLLTSVFVVRQLQPWHENIAKRQVRSPKVYIGDSGRIR